MVNSPAAKIKSLGYRPPAPETVMPPPDMTLSPWLIGKELDKQMVKRQT